MKNENINNVIAGMSALPGIRFGTTVPYSLGNVWIGRIGFASIPVIGTTVFHKAGENIVPVVRQHVFEKLASAGLPYNPTVIQTRPLVGQRSRQRMIIDENQASDSCGKRKRMVEAEFTFEIVDMKTFCNAYGQFSNGREVVV